MPTSLLPSGRINLTSGQLCRLVILLLLIALGVTLRVIFLNADPSYPEWLGYITDEGRWSTVARDMALFSEHRQTWLSSLHVAMAPLYQFFIWIMFETLGVDFWSARIFSAICGSLLLILATRLLYRAGVNSTALFFAVVILALQPDLVFLSRVAIPEMAAALVHFLAFLVLIRDAPSVRSAAFAGLITAIGVAMKATTIPIVIVFAAIAAYCGVAGQKQRIRFSLWYTFGVAVPGLIVLGTIIWFGGLQGFYGIVMAAAEFSDFSSLYGAVGFLFENRFLQPVNFLLLVAWSIGSLLYFRGQDFKSNLGKIYVASGIWVVGWIVTASLMSYFPSRYFIQILLPLSIHLSVGLTLLSRKSDSDSESATVVTDSWIAAAAFSLPIAVLFTPLLAGLFGELVPAAHRLRGHLALITITTIILTFVGSRISITRRAGVIATLFPILVAIGWFVAVSAEAFPTFFWDSSERQYMPVWITIFVVAGLISASVSHPLRTLHRFGPVIGGFTATMMILFFTIQLSESYVDRQYTIRDTSIEIGSTLGEAQLIVSNRAESMFLANRVQYSMVQPREKPAFIVTAFDKIRPERLNGFTKTQTYSLNRHPDYGKFNPETSSEIVISIYRNNELQN